MAFKKFLTIFLFCIIAKAEEFVLPDGIKTCSRNHPDLNLCLKEAFQEQFKLGNKENKELNLPQLDPWTLPKSRVENQAIGVEIILITQDVKIYGMSKTIIRDVNAKINETGISMELEAYFPTIFMDGNYKAHIKINEMKLRPKGHFNLTMNDITNRAKLSGTFQINNGTRYFRLKKFNIEPEIGNAKFNADGLLPDSALNNVVVAFINEYWPNLYKILLSESKTTWEPILVETTNKFLTYVPFDKLITGQ